jgi:hypothetical protein
MSEVEAGLGPVAPGIERGEAAVLTLVLGLGLVVLPVLMLVTSIAIWEQRAVDAQDLARAGARALATAGDWAAGTEAAGQDMAALAAAEDLALPDLSIGYRGALVPGGSVTVTVTVTVPMADVPGFGAMGTHHYTASSTQLVDYYRGGPG